MKKGILFFDIIALLLIVALIMIVNSNKKTSNNVKIEENKNEYIDFTTMEQSKLNKYREYRIKDKPVGDVVFNTIKISYDDKNDKFIIDMKIKNKGENDLTDKNFKISILNKDKGAIENIYTKIDKINAGEEIEYGVQLNSDKNDIADININEIKITEKIIFNDDIQKDKTKSINVLDKIIDNIKLSNFEPIRLNEEPILYMKVNNTLNSQTTDKFVRLKLYDNTRKEIEEIYIVLDKMSANEEKNIGIKLSIDQSKIYDIDISEIQFAQFYEYSK